MCRTDEQIKNDIQNEIKLYKEEKDDISTRYLNLQKKFESMQILELNLRYENYQLKKQLDDILSGKFKFKQEKEQQNHLKSISFFLEEILNILNEFIEEEDQHPYLTEVKEIIHRPSNEEYNSSGLGKEIMLQMEDNKMTNDKNHSQNEKGDNEKHQRIIDENSSGQELPKNLLQEEHQGAKEKSLKQKVTITKKEQLKENKNKPIETGLKGFNELKKLMNDTKGKEHISDEKVSEKDTSQYPDTQNTALDNQPIENKLSNFTFRDLQKAKQIYSKPEQRKNIVTTTSVNRKIEDYVIVRNQKSKQDIISNHIEDEDKNKVKRVEDKKINEEQTTKNEKTVHLNIEQKNKEENIDEHSEKQLSENRVYQKEKVKEDKDPNQIQQTKMKLDNREEKSAINLTSNFLESNSNENDTQEKNSSEQKDSFSNNQNIENHSLNYPMNESKRQNETTDKIREEAKQDKNDQKSLLTSEIENSIPIQDKSYDTPENENQQRIKNKYDVDEINSTHPNEVKNESFFKSLWKKIMKE